MRYLFIVCCFLVFSGIALAQDDGPVCPPEQLPNAIDEMVVQLEALKTNEDLDTTTAMLIIRTMVETVYATCASGVFTSESHPNGIIGPINFTGRVYELTLEGDEGNIFMDNVVIDGDCGFNSTPSVYFDSIIRSDTTLYQIRGDCLMMFEVDARQATSWSLTITRIA